MNKTKKNTVTNISLGTLFEMQSKDTIKILKNLYLEQSKLKHPNIPDYARSVPTYTDKTTKGLTKCVMDYVRFNGYHIERTGCEGRVIDNRKIVTDTIGRTQMIGSIQRIKSSSQRGTSDLKAIIKGRFIAIEIKCKATKDKQRPEQKEYQNEIEKAGGVYIIVDTFSSFYNWFNQFTEVQNG